MNVRFRVAVATIDGRPLMEEYFEDAPSKDAFLASVLSTQESLLDGLQGVDSATVEVSELCYGSWVTVNRKLVRIR